MSAPGALTSGFMRPCVIVFGPRGEKPATLGADASVTVALFFTVAVGNLHHTWSVWNKTG
jgi:hypothetical protein